MQRNIEAKNLVNIIRGKDPMNGLCETKQITPEACDWLKSSLDPFHDLQLDNIKGYPDVSTEPTVIIKVRQAIEVSRPSGLKDDENWDCHVVLSPIDYAQSVNKLKEDGVAGPQQGYNVATRFAPQSSQGLPAGTNDFAGATGTAGQSGVTGRLDGLLINSVPSNAPEGGDLTYTPGHCPSSAQNGYALDQINLDDFLDYDKTDLGAYRLIYSGFECVNTTADIYKQGAVTVYEYGQPQDPSQVLVNRESPGATTGDSRSHMATVSTNTFRCPPNNLAEAKIMPGAHTWAAREGCYVTAKFQSQNNFQGVTQRNYIIAQNNEKSEKDSGYLTHVGTNRSGSFSSPGLIGEMSGPQAITGPAIQLPDGSTDNSPYNAAPAVHFSRMNTAGAYFTGLSHKSTLLITWRVGLEILPSANRPTFLALAQPSATYDPNALVLYNLVANNLPPGCPQDWNDLGRWFTIISDIAKRVIPAAYPLVGAAQMVMKGIGAGAEAIETIRHLKGPQPPGPIRVNAASKRQQRRAQPYQRPPQQPAVQNFGTPAQPRKVRMGRVRRR